MLPSFSIRENPAEINEILPKNCKNLHGASAIGFDKAENGPAKVWTVQRLLLLRFQPAGACAAGLGALHLQIHRREQQRRQPVVVPAVNLPG